MTGTVWYRGRLYRVVADAHAGDATRCILAPVGTGGPPVAAPKADCRPARARYDATRRVLVWS